MIKVSKILARDAKAARGLLYDSAAVTVTTGARTAASRAERIGDLETWAFQRTEDAESLLALLEDYRRRWNPGRSELPSIHSIDRFIAKLTAALL
jgi:hypothetical protein